MSINQRTPFKLPSPGPYIARITSHLDPTNGGGVEAVLEKGTLNNPEYKNYVFPLHYLSPFYGVTGAGRIGTDATNFYDVKKSYGMWMIPPDIGTRVLCIFIDGDSNQGYWLGSIQDRWMNHMVPGIAASQNVAWAPGQKDTYGVAAVPVAEFLTAKLEAPYKPNQENKPVHPFADRLLKQGLLADTVRGITSSSARREFPSRVFGISTPGAPDSNSPKIKVGYKDDDNSQGQREIPTSRLSGHTFVMDDGDVYGLNQLIRLRSGTGHQILLNDSANIIYIANADGTAWLEFTANGKIDIYAQDSVSIHTENDFNFRAERDINLEAMRNVNIKSGNNIVLNSTNDFNLRVTGAGKIYFSGNLDQYVAGDLNLSANGTANIFSQAKVNLTSKGDVSLISQAAFKVYAASKSQFGKPGDVAAPATEAIKNTTKLTEWGVPVTSVDAGWSAKYQSNVVSSIMQRVPMHEPWIQHESYDPQAVAPGKTDVNNNPALGSGTASGGNANPQVGKPNPNTPPDWTKDTAFINKVKEVAKKYKADYIDLLAVMYFETARSMSPAENRGSSGAVGLIQFTKITEKPLGVTRAQLGQMTRVQQMEYVDKYFTIAGPNRIQKLSSVSLNDLYMAVLCPRTVGKPDTATCYSDLPNWLANFKTANEKAFEAKSYKQNSWLDKNGDHVITKAEACVGLPAAKAAVKKALGV